MNIGFLNNYLPRGIKYLLKPYYRVFMPDRLHIMFWPTFRCNYKCSYCPYRSQHDYTPLFPKEKEKSASEWLEVFRRLAPAVFFIAGGEPFLYEGIVELINEMPAKHKILGIVTNFSSDTAVYKKIKRKICFNISYHRQYTSINELLKKIKQIKEDLPISVFIVATPENIPFIKETKKIFSKNNIFLHVDPYIAIDFKYDSRQWNQLRRYISGERSDNRLSMLAAFGQKTCSAGRNYINLLPDGRAYTCTGGMNYTFSSVRKQIIGSQSVEHFEMGNVFEQDFKINNYDVQCKFPCLDFCDHDYCAIKIGGCKN